MRNAFDRATPFFRTSLRPGWEGLKGAAGTEAKRTFAFGGTGPNSPECRPKKSDCFVQILFLPFATVFCQDLSSAS
jgi:hypothetical protein